MVKGHQTSIVHANANITDNFGLCILVYSAVCVHVCPNNIMMTPPPRLEPRSYILLCVQQLIIASLHHTCTCTYISTPLPSLTPHPAIRRAVSSSNVTTSSLLSELTRHRTLATRCTARVSPPASPLSSPSSLLPTISTSTETKVTNYCTYCTLIINQSTTHCTKSMLCVYRISSNLSDTSNYPGHSFGQFSLF